MLLNTIFKNKKSWLICTYFWIQSLIFGSAPKRFFFKWFLAFFNKMLVPHSATKLAAPVTLSPHRVEYGVSHPLTPSSSPVTVLYCTILYCTVLHCTVLYCTLPHCHIVSSHCVLALCQDIVSWHCFKTLCPDIVSKHCVCKLNVCSLLLGCKSRGWDREGLKGPPGGQRPPALCRS